MFNFLIAFIFSVTVFAEAPIISVAKYINHTAKEKTRNEKAIDKIKETFRGQCFQNELAKKGLIQTNGKTNAQVLSEILSSDVKISLQMYRNRWNSTVGYTYPSTKNIWCNRKYHDHMDPCDVGANIAHEFTHKIGYSHDMKANKTRPNSVPYAVGYIVEKCCKD